MLYRELHFYLIVLLLWFFHLIIHYLLSIFDYPLFEHLDCFQFGAIPNEMTINIGIKAFFEHMYSFLMDKYVKEKLLGLTVGVSFTLYETARLFSKIAFYILLFNQPCTRVLVNPCLGHLLILSVFFILATLVGI